MGVSKEEGRRSLNLAQAFKQSNDVMFYCDRDGVILEVNDAFPNHYGYTRKEAVGRTPDKGSAFRVCLPWSEE